MNILIDGQTLHTAEINRGIGTYFKEMIESMLRNDFTSKFYITVDDIKKLDCFSQYVKDKIVPIVDKNANPNVLLNQDRKIATNIYTDLIAKVCEQENTQVYWNVNPQMDNTILPEKKGKCVKYVATLYDLIPLVMKDVYFKNWPDFIKNEYEKKIVILKEYDHFFPISKSTKKDFSLFLKIDKNKQSVAFCGVSTKFTPYPFPKIDAKDKYILYIGGFDPRKNMFRAIEAFAYFMSNFNTENIEYKLYLVCSLDENAKSELLQFAKEKKIHESLHLTGFVEENELLKLYQKATAFFFPSLYEGFGLPVLEALASGLPLACADNSSLPEVAGEYANYFDAYDIEDMANALKKTLKQSITQEARYDRYEYASKYNWQEPAKILLNSLYLMTKKEKKKKKIAWVSPFPPQQSGISNYSKILVLAMKNRVDIDLYYDEIKPDKELSKRFNLFAIENLSKKYNEYDEVIYHIGNNSDFHTNIYKYAWNNPSTVVIHDWNIHPFMQHSFFGTNENRYYEDALKIYGIDGEEEYKETQKRGYPDVWKFSMSDAIAKRSKRVIVHHQWVKEQFVSKENVETIPLFSHIDNVPSQQEINKFREKFAINKKEFLISCFGDVNTNKLPQVQIEAVKILIDLGYPIKLLFVGKVPVENSTLFENLGKHKDKISTTGYLSTQEYYSCMYTSDCIINLRNPSMGEASLTLAEALYIGKPTIIGNLNQYKEFPDDSVAGKVNYDGGEVEQLVKLLKKTLSDCSFRTAVGRQAKNYAKQVLSIDKVVGLYLEG